MRTITAKPDPQGIVLVLPWQSLNAGFSGYYHAQIKFSYEVGTPGTKIFLTTDHTDPEYTAVAKGLLGSKLYEAAMADRELQRNIPVFPMHMKNILAKLNRELIGRNVCEICFHTIAVEGIRTCRPHKPQAKRNMARRPNRYANMSFGEMAERIIEILELKGPEGAFNPYGGLRHAARSQELITRYLSQDRWQMLVDDAQVTVQERNMTVWVLREHEEGLLRISANIKRLKEAQEAYTAIYTLILRELAQNGQTPPRPTW